MTPRFLLRGALVAALPVFLLLLLSLQPIAPIIAPPSIEAQLEEARRAGHVMQALYLTESLAAQSGWTPALLRQAGDLWRDAGDVSRALPYWESAAQANPDDTTLARALAQSYIEAQRWTQAADTLDRLASLAPDDQWTHLQLGLIRAAFDPRTAAAQLQLAAREPAYTETTTKLLDVLTTDPADPLISMRVGLALADLELWPYAELAFTHAANVNAPYADALAYVALARDSQGKDGSAWIEQAVTLDPRNARVRFLQGLHLRSAGDEAGSIDALVAAMALDPENPAYYAELSTAYRLAGDLDHAEYWLRMAVLVSDDDPRFQEMLALFYADEAPNLTDTGVQALADAASHLSDDPDVQAGYGWALYTLGQKEDGIAQIDAALAAAPDNPRALYYKGRTLLDAGDTDAALPLLQRVASGTSPLAAEAQRVIEGVGG